MITFWRGKLVTVLLEECSMYVLECMGGSWEIVDTLRKRRGFTDYIAVLRINGMANHVAVRRGKNGRSYYIGCVYDMPGEDAYRMERYIFKNAYRYRGGTALEDFDGEFKIDTAPALVSCMIWLFLGFFIFHLAKLLFLGRMINGIYAVAFLFCHILALYMRCVVHSRPV